MSEIFKKVFEINLNEYENIHFDVEINKVVVGGFNCHNYRRNSIKYLPCDDKKCSYAACKARGVHRGVG